MGCVRERERRDSREERRKDRTKRETLCGIWSEHALELKGFLGCIMHNGNAVCEEVRSVVRGICV